MEKRSVADQLIDQIMETDPTRYRVYADIRRKFEHEPKIISSNVEPLKHEEAVLGAFMRNWIELEKYISLALRAKGLEGPQFIINRSVFESFVNLDPEMRREMDRIRQIRNRAVHGRLDLDVNELKEATRSLKRILRHIKDGGNSQSEAAV